MRFEFSTPTSAAAWAVAILAALLALIGATLFLGGAYLAMLGGSWYYVLANLDVTTIRASTTHSAPITRAKRAVLAENGQRTAHTNPGADCAPRSPA
jgi:hypothetical protein